MLVRFSMLVAGAGDNAGDGSAGAVRTAAAAVGVTKIS